MIASTQKILLFWGHDIPFLCGSPAPDAPVGPDWHFQPWRCGWLPSHVWKSGHEQAGWQHFLRWEWRWFQQRVQRATPHSSRYRKLGARLSKFCAKAGMKKECISDWEHIGHILGCMGGCMGLEPRTPSIWERLVDEEGFTPVALDVPGLSAGARLNGQVVSIDRYLDREDRLRLELKMTRTLSEWLNHCRQARGTHASVLASWAQSSVRNLGYLLPTVFGAQTLARKWSGSEVVSLAFVEQIPPRPGFFFTASDLCAKVWGELLPDKCFPLRFTPFPQKTSRPEASDFSRLAGRTAFCMHFVEDFRFRELIKQTAALRPTALLLIDAPESVRAQAEKNFAIPVCSLFLPPDGVISRKHQGGADLLRDIFPAALRDAIPFFFDAIGQYSQRLEHLQEILEHAFARHRPEHLILSINGSSLIRALSRAGRRFEIPTGFIPHTAVLSEIFDLQPSDCGNRPIACASPLQATVYRQHGMAASCLSHVVAYDEYCMDNHALPFPEKKFSVLVLCSVCSLPQTLSRVEGTEERAELLHFFHNPPETLRNKINVRFKFHPGMPERIVAEAAGLTDEEILPPDSNLAALLPQTHCAIHLNYVGPPLLQTVCAAIPSVCLFTLPHFNQAPQSGFWASFFSEGGVSFMNDPHEIWKFIHCLVQDKSRYASISRRHRDFAARQLAPGSMEWKLWLSQLGDGSSKDTGHADETMFTGNGTAAV